MRVRCSAIGKIMTKPRSKSEVLSETCKSYIEEILLEDMYGLKNEFSNKYTSKGNTVEQDSIDLCNDVLDLGFLYKNEESFENEYITGTPDVLTPDCLLDVKSSWSSRTFPLTKTKIPTKDYYYQLMGYMWLSGMKEATLVYCLVDTPKNLVEDEVFKVHKLQGLSVFELDNDLTKEVKSRHEFSAIPKSLRVKTFKVEYSEEVVMQIKEKILACREYYDKTRNFLLENV